jgi:hypothetical protein
MWNPAGKRTLRTILTLAWLAATAGLVSAQSIGPSTTTEPYLLPSPSLPPGAVQTISILTASDTIDGYRMVGIPDGLGAFRDGARNFTLLMNHELGAAQGVVRAHGSPGALVSRWRIDRKTLRVLKGEDHTQSPNDVYTWDKNSHKYVRGTTAWERLCSADLAAPGAFFWRGWGTTDRIYMNGEETRPPFTADHGRAWARIASGRHKGEAWELPRLGRMSFENVAANPHRQFRTIVMLLDDAAASTSPVPPNVPSELYMYVGTKQQHGTPIERAGLTNGSLYGIKVAVGGVPVTEESDAFGLGQHAGEYVGSGRFSLHDFGDVSSKTGIQLQTDSIQAEILRLQRVEDGAWDPRPGHAGNFYFVTTASITPLTNSRLWHLRFDDIEHPENGGTIEILLGGGDGRPDPGFRMLDNMTIDGRGRILLQEDVGNNARVGKVWLYDIGSKQLIEVAEHNPKFFAPGAPNFLTQDEESSGIIDAGRLLGKGWFLLDVQAHTPIAGELVEGGQLLAMRVDPDLGSTSEDEGEDEPEEEHSE